MVATATRNLARGSFQVKTKRDHFIVRDRVTGETLRDADGNAMKRDAHYLYLRLYVSNHDGTKRAASIYIGSLNRQEPKPFLAAVDGARQAEANDEPIEDWMITREQLITWFEDGGYERVKAERQAIDVFVDK